MSGEQWQARAVVWDIEEGIMCGGWLSTDPLVTATIAVSPMMFATEDEAYAWASANDIDEDPKRIAAWTEVNP